MTLQSFMISLKPQGLGGISVLRSSSSNTSQVLSRKISVRCVASNSELPIEADELHGKVKSAIDFVVSLISDRTEAPIKKKRDKKGERTIYLLAAIASSIGFVTLAAGAVYYRFYWQMQGAVTVPYAEILGTFSLAIGAAVGMEYWARWAHKALWHDSLWNMHESHHKPREGPFEMNDVFAIINAVPAIALMAYGFFNSGIVPGLCFGAGLGITMFGMAYMFVHDGLVHRRFPVGPIADVPYLQKVAAAHQLHHADLFGGVPYGLFLGPQELENVGGEAELQKVLKAKYGKSRSRD